MGSDRCLASFHFSRDLIVGQTGDEQVQDLAFVSCKGVKTLKENRNFCFLCPSHRVSFQRQLQVIQQILVAKWFGKERNGARFYGPHRHGDIAVTRNKDDWKVVSRRN